MNPIKLREYLAAGLPVVSVDLPEVQRYEKLIEIAKGAEEFIENIECCLRKKRRGVLLQWPKKTGIQRFWKLRKSLLCNPGNGQI